MVDNAFPFKDWIAAMAWTDKIIDREIANHNEED